jgi:hypothetical protein
MRRRPPAAAIARRAFSYVPQHDQELPFDYLYPLEGPSFALLDFFSTASPPCPLSAADHRTVVSSPRFFPDHDNPRNSFALIL